MKNLFLLLTSFLISVAVLRAENWPQFRGPTQPGRSAETGARLWSSEVIGEGKVPSTVLGDGLVFTAGGVTAGLKTDPGELIWQERSSAF